ncbi:hypothetical protein BP6252_10877 [Coleophoma cylindrospora]|uniref:Transcription factor domain-containing protein n=1 Tax=Coleophoma cylindrospora TaxID=1849047 RepID=A0A3D8QNG0_9HELO|nr:hypothetical protein BP6252_10877 [Coleophoma cylindrospora]
MDDFLSPAGEKDDNLSGTEGMGVSYHEQSRHDSSIAVDTQAHGEYGARSWVDMPSTAESNFENHLIPINENRIQDSCDPRQSVVDANSNQLDLTVVHASPETCLQSDTHIRSDESPGSPGTTLTQGSQPFLLPEAFLYDDYIPFYQHDRRNESEQSFEGAFRSNLDIHTDSEQDKTISDLELKYLDHWESSVSGLVPAVLSETVGAGDTFPAVKSALLALSACHLSQFKTIKQATLGENQDTTLVPDHQHHLNCRMFYNRAIRQLSEGDILRRIANAPMVLATLLFFSYIEWNSGSFKKFSMHLSGIQKLLSAGFEHVSSTSLGSGLLHSWINLQAQHWWKLNPLTQWTFEKVVFEMGMTAQFADDYPAPGNTREKILILLCETRRLNELAYMEKYLGRDEEESLTLRAYRHLFNCLKRPGLDRPGRPILPDISGGYLKLLGEQAEKLDKWHACLSTTDLPVESFTAARLRSMLYATSTTTTTTTTVKTTSTTTSSETTSVSTTTVSETTVQDPLIISPLQFSSHETAMNYAYYACAQIIQDTDLLLEQTTVSKDEESQLYLSTTKINPWILLLLRISAGLDPGTCERQNCYTIGLTELLIEAVKRCPLDSVLSYVHRWVERVEAAEVFQESGNLISISLNNLSKIKEERAQGRYVWHIQSDANGDTEWCDTSASSAYIGSLVLLGKDVKNGTLFSKMVVIE